jgi:hypothetical protein
MKATGIILTIAIIVLVGFCTILIFPFNFIYVVVSMGSLILIVRILKESKSDSNEKTLKLKDGEITLPRRLADRVECYFTYLPETTYEQVCDFLDTQVEQIY